MSNGQLYPILDILIKLSFIRKSVNDNRTSGPSISVTPKDRRICYMVTDHTIQRWWKPGLIVAFILAIALISTPWWENITPGFTDDSFAVRLGIAALLFAGAYWTVRDPHPMMLVAAAMFTVFALFFLGIYPPIMYAAGLMLLLILPLWTITERVQHFLQNHSKA